MEKNVIDIICCPACQSDLVQEGKNLICQGCSTKYYEKERVLVLISKELEDELRYG